MKRLTPLVWLIAAWPLAATPDDLFVKLVCEAPDGKSEAVLLDVSTSDVAKVVYAKHPSSMERRSMQVTRWTDEEIVAGSDYFRIFLNRVSGDLRIGGEIREIDQTPVRRCRKAQKLF